VFDNNIGTIIWLTNLSRSSKNCYVFSWWEAGHVVDLIILRCFFFSGYSEHMLLPLKCLVLIAEVLYSYFLVQLKLCRNQSVDPNHAVIKSLGETFRQQNVHCKYCMQRWKVVSHPSANIPWAICKWSLWTTCHLGKSWFTN